MSKGLKQNKRNLFLLLKIFFIFSHEKEKYLFNSQLQRSRYGRPLQACSQRKISKTFHERNFQNVGVLLFGSLFQKNKLNFCERKKKAKINKSFVLNIKIVTVICLHSRRQKSIPTHVLIHAHLQIIVSCVCSLRTITALHNFPSLITLGSKSQLCRPFTQTLSPAYDMFSFASPVSWEY